jgi:hypothetical protein
LWPSQISYVPVMFGSMVSDVRTMRILRMGARGGAPARVLEQWKTEAR